MDDWTKHAADEPQPVDGEQRVEVRWRNHRGVTTKHRADVLNWREVTEYRLLPNPAHAQS